MDNELEILRRVARDFAGRYFTRELAREVDLKEEFPWELYRKAGELRLLSPATSEELGGGGFGSFMSEIIVIEELVRAEPTLGQAIMSGCTFAHIVELFGTEEQRRKYLPEVFTGMTTFFGAFTEPEHGSDINKLSTVATRKGGYFILRGVKTFITNATTAKYGVVLAQTKPSLDHRGQTLFIIHTDWPGVRIRPIRGKMGQRGSPIGELVLEDVEVPEDNILGGELDRGFYRALFTST